MLHVYTNGKVSVVFNCNCCLKMKDFSKLRPLQAVKYTVKMVGLVLKKWCKIDTLLLHTTNRKYHMASWDRQTDAWIAVWQGGGHKK